MRLFEKLGLRLRTLFRRERVEAELDEEMRYHIERQIEQNIVAGMTPREARRAALRQFGGVEQIKEDCRDNRLIRWLADLVRDLAHAWRRLAASPGFTSLAVVTMALGVGASIAVYALSEALLLRSLPYSEPERLVSIVDSYLQVGSNPVGQEEFRDWQEANTVFERMALTEMLEMTLSGDGGIERVEGRSVSEGFFLLLGVQPQLGRWFTPEEERPGADCVVMVSHGFWVRRLQASPEAVGSTVIMNDGLCRVTGVMPEHFRFNESGNGVAEYWRPITYVTHARLLRQYSAYARLSRGVSIEAAQAQMSEIADRLALRYPEHAGWGVRVTSMRAELLKQFGPELLIFAAAALIVLLVACANVASLLLARGIGRSREIAVRVAMGAGRARVVRMLLAESLLLSGMSAALGVAFAVAFIRVAISVAPARVELGETVSVSATLVIFVVGLTVLTGLLAGLGPALQGSRTELETNLRESAGALVAGKRQVRSLDALVIAEVALSVVLLAFAGLLAKSFAHLLETRLGFRTDHLLTFELPLPGYQTFGPRLRFWNRLLPQLATVPGVLSVAASESIPLAGRYLPTPLQVQGQTGQPGGPDVMAHGVVVTPDYFRTMGIELRDGRTFNATDTIDVESVAIVNEAFVRRLPPGLPPIGARVRVRTRGWMRIVGVVGDARYLGPANEPEAEVYSPYSQVPYLRFVSIHTAVPEQGVIGEIREIIRRIDPGLVMTQVRTMRQAVDQSISFERQMMALLVGSGLVALVMAVMGLGGVMLYTVSRRRREIGLRMALGARPADVSRGVLGSAARLVVEGSAIGVLAALAGGRVLESLLYGVRWYDPIMLIAAPAALAVIALAACLLPARRAARVDPMTALRCE